MANEELFKVLMDEKKIVDENIQKNLDRQLGLYSAAFGFISASVGANTLDTIISKDLEVVVCVGAVGLACISMLLLVIVYSLATYYVVYKNTVLSAKFEAYFGKTSPKPLFDAGIHMGTRGENRVVGLSTLTITTIMDFLMGFILIWTLCSIEMQKESLHLFGAWAITCGLFIATVFVQATAMGQIRQSYGELAARAAAPGARSR